MNEMTPERARAFYEKQPKEKLVDYLLKMKDKQAREIIKEEFSEVDENDIKDYLKTRVKSTIKDTKFVQHFFFSTDEYRDRATAYHATDFSKRLFEECITDEIKEELGQMFKSYIEQNFDNIFKKVMVDIFVLGITNTKPMQDALSEAISTARECY